MLTRYHPVISKLPAEARAALRTYFRLPRSRALIPAMEARGLCQADLVLALLRTHHIPAAEALVGHPIRRALPSPLPAILSPPSTYADYIFEWLGRHPAAPDARITRVDPNPSYPEAKRGGRSMTSPSFYRYACLRAGMSVTSALSRGVTRRDLREWAQHGWIEVGT